MAGQRVDITRQFLTPSLYCPQVSAPETEWVDACHYLALQSSGQPYTFTNGSAFPPNNPSSPFAISPMYCNVSVRVCDPCFGPPLPALRPAVRVAGGPRISPLAPCFYLLHVLSWSAAETLLDPCPPHPAAPPSQTNDNWATDNTQCLVPGYGAPSLYTSGQIYGTLAPTSYPVTYDQKGACGQVVFTSDLVDKANANNVYGRLYAWKVGKGRAGHMAAPMLLLPLRSTAPSALSGDPLRAGLPNLPHPSALGSSPSAPSAPHPPAQPPSPLPPSRTMPTTSL